MATFVSSRRLGTLVGGFAVSSILVLAATRSSAGDGDPRPPQQAPEQRAADLRARVGDLEQRVGACVKAAKEYADSGRPELAESHMRVAEALKQEAQRIRERIAGGGERHEGKHGGGRARAEEIARAIAELKEQSGREEREGKAAQKEGREQEANAHMERSGALWKKAEELEAKLKGMGSEKPTQGDEDGWRREMKAKIAELKAAAAEMNAKARMFDGPGMEGEAAKLSEKAKAFLAEAAAVHMKMEEMTKARRAAEGAKAEKRGPDDPKAALPAEGTGRQERVEMRAQMERMRAEMEEMRRVIEDLRKAVDSMRAAVPK